MIKNSDNRFIGIAAKSQMHRQVLFGIGLASLWVHVCVASPQSGQPPGLFSDFLTSPAIWLGFCLFVLAIVFYVMGGGIGPSSWGTWLHPYQYWSVPGGGYTSNGMAGFNPYGSSASWGFW